VAWGRNNYGQCNVPALPPGLTYVDVAAGDWHSVARRSDGSVVAWGDNGNGQCNVPALPPGLSYVEVAAGSAHTVARRSDGSVVAWGYNGWGECNVPVLPLGLSYVKVAAATYRTDALVDSGSFAFSGRGCSGSLGVPSLVLTSPLPRIGQTFIVRADSLPLSMAFMLFGLSNLSFAAGPLPLPLGAAGMPGCDLRVSVDLADFQSGTAGSATFSITVPSSTALVGFVFHQQALVPDPGTNPFGAVMSDATTVVVGG
jgi:hypothetical protein